MDGAEFWRQKAAESRKLAETASDRLIRDWHLAAERIWLRAADEADPSGDRPASRSKAA